MVTRLLLRYCAALDGLDSSIVAYALSVACLLARLCASSAARFFSCTLIRRFINARNCSYSIWYRDCWYSDFNLPIRRHVVRRLKKEGSVPVRSSNRQYRGEADSGRILEILIAFAVMTLPMIIFSGLLLGLVFKYRITQNDFISSDLAFDSDQNDSSAYFVQISATTLTIVASWSSTIAPILVSFAITLVSYPVAKGLLTDSNTQDTAQLPTPFQLSLIVRMISSGSFAALGNWLVYLIGWRGRRESQGRAIKSLTTMLVLAIFLR